MGNEQREFMPGNEPTYEVISNKNIRSAITSGLKSAGFETGTSYIPSQSNKNELIIQITRFEGKGVSNTGVISLKAGVDFVYMEATGLYSLNE